MPTAGPTRGRGCVVDQLDQAEREAAALAESEQHDPDHRRRVGANDDAGQPGESQPTATAISGRRSRTRSASTGPPNPVTSWVMLHSASSRPASCGRPAVRLVRRRDPGDLRVEAERLHRQVAGEQPGGGAAPGQRAPAAAVGPGRPARLLTRRTTGSQAASPTTASTAQPPAPPATTRSRRRSAPRRRPPRPRRPSSPAGRPRSSRPDRSPKNSLTMPGSTVPASAMPMPTSTVLSIRTASTPPPSRISCPASSRTRAQPTVASRPTRWASRWAPGRTAPCTARAAS